MSAPACENCGSACVRGRYGFFTTNCGEPECIAAAPKPRRRKRLSPYSEKTLDADFKPFALGGHR